jgi:hypothetical protein
MGIYKYYTPYFFTVSLASGKLDIHLGTSWDYLMRHELKPKLILSSLSNGLLCLCDDIDSGAISRDTEIKGVIHYLKDNSTKRFGFRTRSLNPIEFILFALNYLELSILQTISTRKISFINIFNAKVHYIKAGELLEYRERIRLFTSISNGTSTIGNKKEEALAGTA